MSPAILNQDNRHDPPEWVEITCGHVAIRFRKATCGTGVTEARRRNLGGRRGSLYVSSTSLYNEGVAAAKRILFPEIPAEAPVRLSVVERPRYADADLLEIETKTFGSIAPIKTEESGDSEPKPPHPSGCRHCEYHIHKGEQTGDKCPNCDESFFE